MQTYKTPGAYVQEIATLPASIVEVATAIPAFLGYTEKGGPSNTAQVIPVVKRIGSMLEYETFFGGANPSAFTYTNDSDGNLVSLMRTIPTFDFMLYYSLSVYFKNGGGSCYIVSLGDYSANPTEAHFTAGLSALEKEDEPTLLVMTDAVNLASTNYNVVCQAALAQCNKLGDRFAILDIKENDFGATFRTNIGASNLKYGAAYYPFVQTALTYTYDETKVATAAVAANSAATPPILAVPAIPMSSLPATNTALYQQLKAALAQQYITLPPSGAIAGVYATVDRERGVWKAPANISLSGVIGPVVKINDADQENLNVDAVSGKSINAIRAFSGKGTLVWGARTLAGNDNEWRYVPVRRLFNLIEESTQKATAFSVFEPNDANTWLKVKAMIDNYLYGLWQQGALVGTTPEDAYFVQVGLGKTMTPQDVLEGRMIVSIGVAAVRPAEFILLNFMHKLQQR